MLIKKIYGLHDKEGRYPDRDAFFVSEVDKCPVAIFYSFKKKLKPRLGPQVYLRFADGDDAHKRLVKSLFSLGVVRAVEVPVPEDEFFSGRADAIVDIDNKLYVVEIKAVSRNRFERLSEPDPAQVAQLQLYLHYLNIDRGIILVENKDTQELKEFAVEKDIKLINGILVDFKMLKMQIVNDEVPERPKDLARWKCGYCPYAEICDKRVRK